MNETKSSSRWVGISTLLLVVMTFILIAVGGVVTSRNAGLAVPDWPTSFGRWFVIPLRLWADAGVFWEHNHRLTGALSGLIAIGAFAAVFRRYGKSKLSFFAGLILFLYIVQGVAGGVRVTEQSVGLAILHGVWGQIILALTVVLAVLVKRIPAPGLGPGGGSSSLRRPAHCGVVFAWILVGLVLMQLTLGAVIRHTNTASSIPDAPLVYGKLIPPTTQAEADAGFREFGGEKFRVYITAPSVTMREAEAEGDLSDSLETAATRPAEPAKLVLVWHQYAHRVMGMVLIPLGLVGVGYRLSRDGGAMKAGRMPMIKLVFLLIVQVLLGLSVIWSHERWEIATGHQAVGALILAVATWLAIRLHYPLPPEVLAEPTA